MAFFSVKFYGGVTGFEHFLFNESEVWWPAGSAPGNVRENAVMHGNAAKMYYLRQQSQGTQLFTD